MTTLTTQALDFAKAHIERFYDSDFFPKALEYDALWAQWDAVKAHLMSRNISKLPVTSPRIVPALKASGGYRMVHQLEPLNALTYTALAYQVAPAVERARSPADVACSYRISTNGNSFFASGVGYDAYAVRCESLSHQFSHVLAADIGDFYNRIYLHRLNNAIVHADAALQSQAKDLEDFLTRLNDKASQGVPVGPAASIIMAEAICTDIDQFVQNKGFVHARYVDDLRVFGNNEVDLECLLEDLVKYLYEVHRLQLSWSKTHVLPASAYRDRYLVTPGRVEKQELLSVVRELSDYPDHYTEEDADALAQKFLAPDAPVPPPPAPGNLASILRAFFHRSEGEHRQTVRREAFSRLLQKAATSKPVDVGLARRVLRTCKAIRSADAVDSLLAHFDLLAPVIPDAFQYLDSITNDALLTKYMPQVRRLPSAVTMRTSQLVRYWFCWWASGHAKMTADREVGQYLLRMAPVEWQARAAVTSKNLAWVRSKKSDLGNLGISQRRAVLVASQVMPKDERKAWLNSVLASSEDQVDKWIVDWVLAMA